MFLPHPSPSPIPITRRLLLGIIFTSCFLFLISLLCGNGSDPKSIESTSVERFFLKPFFSSLLSPLPFRFFFPSFSLSLILKPTFFSPSYLSSFFFVVVMSISPLFSSSWNDLRCRRPARSHIDHLSDVSIWINRLFPEMSYHFPPFDLCSAEFFEEPANS